MTIILDDLVSGDGALYLDDLTGSPATVTSPFLTSLSGAVRRGGLVTVYGGNFGATRGSGQVFISGLVQAVVSWSDDAIVVGPVTRGTLRYGPQNLAVLNDDGESSSAYSITLLPQTGWNYVNLVAPLASSGQRITATPDLAAGNQLAWGDIAPAGTVTVAANATFIADGIVGSFSVEAHDGIEWGGFGVQTLSENLFDGSLTAQSAAMLGLFLVAEEEEEVGNQFSGQLQAGNAAVSGTFTTVVLRSFTGQLQAQSATMTGSFSVFGGGVVAPPPPTGTPVGGGVQQSVISICNLSLTKLGARHIRSFEDRSKAARLFSQSFSFLRDQELSRRWWQFATARRALPVTGDARHTGQYRYAYALPTDWLGTIMVGDTRPTLADDNFDADEWRHEGNLIYAHIAPPLPLVYIARVTDVTRYHSLFVEVLACRLAMQHCKAITGSMSMWDALSESYRLAIGEAARANAILDPPQRLNNDSADTWLRSRH